MRGVSAGEGRRGLARPGPALAGAVGLLTAVGCGNGEECRPTSVTLASVASGQNLRAVQPIGQYLPPGTMLTLGDDGSVVVLARAVECFLEPLGTEVTRSAMQYSNSSSCSTGVSAELSHELLPVSLSVETGTKATARLSFSEMRTEQASELALRRAINAQGFPMDCLALVAAGVQIVSRSGALVDFSAETVDTTGSSVTLDAKIPDANVDVSATASDSVSTTNTLRATEPVTIGVAVVLGTDLVEMPTALPDVAVSLPEEVPAQPSAGSDAGAPSPERDGAAWLRCHQACSDLSCRSACADSWFDCRKQCAVDRECAALCDASQSSCAQQCDEARTACGALCDGQYL